MLFYVSGVKIYSSNYDESKKVYPEFKVARREDGSIGVVSAGGGISIKPKQRAVCTTEELIAQFGGTVAHVTEQPKTGGDDGDKDQKDGSTNK